LLNLRNRLPVLARLGEQWLGFSARRSLPEWKTRTFFNTRHDTVTRTEVLAAAKPVVLFVDTFNGIFEDDNASAAIRVLNAGGYAVHVATKTVADGKHLCCGRTYLSSGMVDEARAKARELIDSLLPFAAQGIAIVGLEPSCLLTLRDEALTLGLGEAAHTVSRQALLLEEFLAREAAAGKLEDLKSRLRPATQPILLHGHCHQKAFDAVRPILDVIRLIPGAMPELIESSCCGMAGTFGYEARHIEVSMQMAELSLLPAVRNAARCLDRGRWYELPASDPRRCAARGCARGAPAGRSSGPLNATESSCGGSSKARCRTTEAGTVQGVTHHGAVSCARPIQSAHADVAASAKPARRMPQAPLPRLPNRSNTQGPTKRETLLPSANNAMANAPSKALPLSAATSKAEYNSPQGMNAHIAPMASGAPWPQAACSPRMRNQTRRAASSSHTGWRASRKRARPRIITATWNSVQTGRIVAVCVVSQPNPCIEAAASAPSRA
jgi:hypothetical protein